VGQYVRPSGEEDPFFVLLEDDAVITKISAETDTLLEPATDPPNPNDARLVITVRLKPGRVHADNLGFI
jgi:hypothetical protein